MGHELPPDAARLRVATDARLCKLSAAHVQPSSPAVSPSRARAAALARPSSSSRFERAGLQLDTLPAAAPSMAVGGSGAAPDAAGSGGGNAREPPLPNGAAHHATSSSGGSSDQASPRFLDMLRASLPREDDADGGGQHGVPSGTLAALHALNSHNAAAAGGAGEGLANGSGAVGAGGKKHKRGLLGLFRSGKGSKAARGAEPAEAAGDAAGGKRKSGSTWFGGGSKAASSSSSAAPSPRPAPPQLGPPPREQHGGVLLPGLPVHPAGSNDGGGSGADEHSGSARGTLTAGGTPASPMPLGAAALASASSLPSSAQPSPAAGSLGLPPGMEAPGGGKKGHRRHRSISSMLLPGWRRKGSASAGSEAELAGDATPPRGASLLPSRAASPAPKSAEALAAAFSEGELVLRRGASEAEALLPPAPLLPPGITGLRNIGNTCFVNAAIQCLRYTPSLPLHVAPDLLAKAAAAGAPAAAPPAAEPPPTAEDVHAQALARASVDQRLPASATPEAAPEPGDEAVTAASGTAAPSEAAPQAAAEAGGGEARSEVDEAAAAVAATGGAASEEPAGSAPQVAQAEKVPAQAEASGAEAPPPSAEAPLPAAATSQPEASGAETPPPAAAAEGEQQAGASPATAAAPTAAAQAEATRAVAAPAPSPAKPARPARGALLKAFADLITELYLPSTSGASGAAAAVCATPLLRTLRAFPVAADYFDGGQHDCQEVLRVIMDLLHDDLNRVPPRPSSAATPDAGKAAAAAAGDQPGPPLPDTSIAAEAGGQAQGQAAATAGAEQPSDHPSPAAQQEQAEEQPGHAQAAAADAEPPGTPPADAGGVGGSPVDRGQEGQEGQAAAEDESAKADRFWRQYLERDDSPITDLFGGQLQSSVTCHKCGGRFTMYEPFWDLSLPLARESKGGSFAWLGLKGATPASIQDCLTAFTADERMEGVEAFHCERCGEKTAATKHLRVHRFPEVLVLHIKRFKLRGASTDKLTASVSFPLEGLRLHAFASPECPAAPAECTYNLFAVSNHYGNLSGGHYTAMCRVPQAGGDDAWYSFNDEQVSRVSPSQVVSQYAYILFYVRSRASSVAHHRRNHSAASAGNAAVQ